MVKTGLDLFEKELLPLISGKKTAVVCHAPSINKEFSHITDIIHSSKRCHLSAIFGPQHGMFGQTQDNMIEWEGYLHPVFEVPVYSLYGTTRKPYPEMLKDTDCLVIDLQDVGARPYTYVWTMKLCMEACRENGIKVIIIDRPNPISAINPDGPVLKKEFYTFVGGAEIPLSHNITIGELSLWLNEKENIHADLHIIQMQGWKREMLFSSSGLPWVLPSPNMPALSTAIVYPGMVLIEALNLSEGRGTTLPFELIGAPFIQTDKLLKRLSERKLPGCAFRMHNFIPTFHKFSNQLCNGIQIHVYNHRLFEPVFTAASLFQSIMETSADKLTFIDPPYEYEENLIPFDILSGNSGLRETLESYGSLKAEREKWKSEIAFFQEEFQQYSLYR